MSNAIPFDPLLVRYLAGELDERLRGRACASAPLFASERVALLALDGGEALRLDLHPERGWVRLVPWESDAAELDAVCEGVESPADERLLSLRIRSTDRFRAESRRLIVELHTNQWNSLLVADDDDRILSVLWSRSAGGRSLRTGSVYSPPPPSRRFGAEATSEGAAREEWLRALGAVAPEARRGALLAGFASTGAASAGPILGSAANDPSEEALLAAFARWWWLRSLPPARPVLLRPAARLLPYPVPLPEVESTPVASLLAGMERAADEASAAAPAPALPGVEAVRRRAEAAARRVERLESQVAGTAEVERMRLWGDLLLARKRLVPRGAERVKLQDWTGALVEVTLDPTLTPAENANRWYDEARKRERADARIPGLLAAARAELERWRGALGAAERGEVPAWAAEAARGAVEGRGAEVESLPYRSYRTSGGLEVRVGRSARANDDLTFRHSAPGDVWLHARSVPGSHVILRWRSPDGSPPARDLEEAATLAALFSKARSSGLVPVDWTRRKHVRKPRGAPPGAVVPQQVRTIFVEPDARVEERMRTE